MKPLPFILALLLVAVLFYRFGRRQTLQPITASKTRLIQNTTPPTNPSAAIAAGQIHSPAKTTPPADQNIDTYPFAASASAARRGYEAAAANLEAAIAQIASIPDTDRRAFTIGVFSFVAQSRSPAEALKLYQTVPETVQGNALRGLVGEWIYNLGDLPEGHLAYRRDQAFSANPSRTGLETQLTSDLVGAVSDTEVLSAWLDTFSNRSSRSEIFLILSGKLLNNNPEALLQRAENWSSWEKERAANAVLGSWAYKSPSEAWQWYNNHRDRFDQDLSSAILDPWASNDVDAVKRLLDSTDSSDQRTAIIKTVGKVLAGKNTGDALRWAETLADSTERQSAHAAVYDAAPRGIGARLTYDNGFPTINGILPGGPLSGTGMQVGDQIFEIHEANSAPKTLYGRDLQTAINALRGEPGTELTVRVLRKNLDTGQLEDHTIPITRAQLYLDEKALPSPFVPVKNQ